MTLRNVAVALGIIAIALAHLYVADANTDWPPVALCPNYDSAIVHPTPWEAAHGRLVRTKPASCADTTAVTFGYLR